MNKPLISKLFGDITRKVPVWAGEYIVQLEKRDHEKRTGKHYGLYGTACARTGQLDAGLCWKCEIAKLEEELEKCEERLKEATQYGD